MLNARTISMPDGVWAENAETNIPIPPIPGTAYRNPSVNLPEWNGGQRFEMIVDSSKWNQLFYLLTGMIKSLEETGILVWSSQTNYLIGSIAMGLDGTLHQAIAASGPNNAGAQPTSNAGYWKPVIPTIDTYVLTVNGG